MGNLFSDDDNQEVFEADSLTMDERQVVDRAVDRSNQYRKDIEQLAQQTHNFLSIPTPKDGKLTWAQKKEITNIQNRYLDLEGQHTSFLAQMTEAFTVCARGDPNHKGRTCSALESSGEEFRKSADQTTPLIYLAANMKWMMDLSDQKGDGKLTDLNNTMTAAEARNKQIRPPWFS